MNKLVKLGLPVFSYGDPLTSYAGRASRGEEGRPPEVGLR
jgi:hypothetical protein